jgi:hypothetical protein
MSVVEPPTRNPGDDLDGLLRRFFRSQLPHPWPASRVNFNAVGQRRPAIGLSIVRSRWTLAASVALLFIGSLLLPSRFTRDTISEHGLGGPMISDLPPDIGKQHNKSKKAENKPKPALEADPGDQLPELEDSELPLPK